MVCARHTADRRIAWWLFACCAMVFVMVVLGGVTRLTDSGLSIVQWRPISGVLPPLDAAAWEREFENYKHYPEFQQLNRDMTLDGFKSIFWLEYLHRLWGRLIGIVFLVPFVYFLATGRLQPAIRRRLAAIFALGAMQGVLGWYMVMSGLVQRPDVSQYRLVAHLSLAFFLYGYMLWVALDLWRGGGTPAPRALRRAAVLCLALVCAAVVSGGFVAGTDAGFAYNTFPLMAGRWIPEEYARMEPFWRNLFENIAAVQFNHRVLTLSASLCAIALWWHARRTLAGRARLALHALGAAALLQPALGIATLLLAVPVPLAAAHQAGGLVLFSVALWLVHALGGAPGAPAGGARA
ncbi:MAG: COX15/CtaA family protein [Gammaproteobacteria bacterium]